eukprot:TRINITY_DN4958_c1_g1_i1.p1 TRINITY_DN4958_c1_g1~~TRINITY_DN4958_c1_g1_i1.p1  ORF type:complete len:418 (+),score=63.17 TRINITY_DN4958_c1_g1_i1:41-1255(+)
MAFEACCARRHKALAPRLVAAFAPSAALCAGPPSDDTFTQQLFYGSLTVCSLSLIASIFTPYDLMAVHIAVLVGNTNGMAMAFHWVGSVWSFLVFFVMCLCAEVVILQVLGVSSRARRAHVIYLVATMWAAYASGHRDRDLVDAQATSKSSTLTISLAISVIVATTYLQLSSDSKLRRYFVLMTSCLRGQFMLKESQIQPVIFGAVWQASNEEQSHPDGDLDSTASSGGERATADVSGDLPEDEQFREDVDEDAAPQYARTADALAALFTLPEHARGYGAALVSFLQLDERMQAIRSVLMERTAEELSRHIASFMLLQPDSATATCDEEEVPSTEVYKVRREVHTQDEGFGVFSIEHVDIDVRVDTPRQLAAPDTTIVFVPAIDADSEDTEYEYPFDELIIGHP